MNQITAIFVDYDVLYSRLWNKRSPLNKHSPWNIWKNNKHSPLKKHIPPHQITELQLFFYGLLSLIRRLPLEKNPKIIKCTPMFILESRVENLRGVKSANFPEIAN